jgi:myo-inositol 2-dehydrogenase/D-chiro-inositol 1-dehydrogenase
VTDGDHPYMGKWWVPGLQIGYEHSFVHQVADFLDGLAKGKPAQPDFRNAYHTQLVLDAVLASAQSGQWTRVANA